MNAPFEAILAPATLPYAGSSQYALHFARGKLRHDPVFLAILQQGLLPDSGRLLDLGCGLGVLLALLHVARTQYVKGQWNSAWPIPPRQLELNGIELLQWKVAAGNQALKNKADIKQGDIRYSEFPSCSAVVILDVLLYLNADEQRHTLQRIAQALQPGGVLLLREGNRTGGLRFQITRFAEQLCCLARGQGWPDLHYRSQQQWTEFLQELGFSVEHAPMSKGTPFANVLYIARKR
jgi:SAM-dependent methyltransferase